MKLLLTVLRILFLSSVYFVFVTGCSKEEALEEIAVGESAPDFAIKDMEGNIVILSYFEEQPVVLRFFETDCKFCRADTPIINVYFEKYKDRGLKVFYIAANHESKETVSNFIKDLDVPFPIIMDTEAKIADLYNILLYPQTIMIAPGRKILAIVPGGVGEAELDEMVGPYLQNEPNTAQKM